MSKQTKELCYNGIMLLLFSQSQYCKQIYHCTNIACVNSCLDGKNSSTRHPYWIHSPLLFVCHSDVKSNNEICHLGHDRASLSIGFLIFKTEKLMFT